MEFKSLIRNIPDFPIEGIVFRDITTLLKDKNGLKGIGLKTCRRYPAIATPIPSKAVRNPFKNALSFAISDFNSVISFIISDSIIFWCSFIFSSSKLSLLEDKQIPPFHIFSFLYFFLIFFFIYPQYSAYGDSL